MSTADDQRTAELDGETAWWGSHPITTTQSQAWVTKARARAEEMLALSGPVANPSDVRPSRDTDTADWAFGNFMLAWLDPAPSPRLVHHLPDAAFFLQLLKRTYAPTLQRRPELTALLTDDSRPEMSLTNDVLQIQLHDLGDRYSMIRHHALMLFYAALWLDEPQRSQWLDLYDELVTQLDTSERGRPDLDELRRIEVDAFDDFARLAGQTLDPAEAQELLEHPSALRNVLDYQLCAAVAIGLLWRDYRVLPETDREAWHREQLSERYLQLDYLEEKWTETA
jgi:hypothetical protein